MPVGIVLILLSGVFSLSGLNLAGSPVKDAPHLPPFVDHQPPTSTLISVSGWCRNGKEAIVQARSVWGDSAELVIVKFGAESLSEKEIAKANQKILSIRGIKTMEISCSSTSNLITLQGYEPRPGTGSHSRSAYVFIENDRLQRVDLAPK